MDNIADFVAKKRKKVTVETIEEKIKKLPWYRRPISKEAFTTRKGKDKKLYVHHCEWSEHVWIGPYDTTKDVDCIIDSYVTESLRTPLDKKQTNLIHSVFVDDVDDFFVKKT